MENLGPCIQILTVWTRHYFFQQIKRKVTEESYFYKHFRKTNVEYVKDLFCWPSSDGATEGILKKIYCGHKHHNQRKRANEETGWQTAAKSGSWWLLNYLVNATTADGNKLSITRRGEMDRKSPQDKNA